MRLARSLVATVASLAFTGCLSDNVTEPPARIPIDCETLATSLTASEASLTTTESGLKYRDQTVGTGATIASGQSLAIHYSGCLTDGTKFDKNTNTESPLVFTVGSGQLIQGFDEGVVGMKVGGRRQLVIPPELAFGELGSPPAIPPNATLVFTVDALAVQ
jgi:peptidylprolyl isomerase